MPATRAAGSERMSSLAFSLDRSDGELEVLDQRFRTTAVSSAPSLFIDLQRLAARFVPSLRSRNNAEDSSKRRMRAPRGSTVRVQYESEGGVVELGTRHPRLMVSAPRV